MRHWFIPIGALMARRREKTDGACHLTQSLCVDTLMA
jgi:hypothetical protein